MQHKTNLAFASRASLIDRYNPGARALHWLIALLIGGMYLTDQVRGYYERGAPERDWWLAAHSSLGISIFALTLLRMAWRFIAKPPVPVPGPKVMHLAAGLGHLALYGFTFGLPLSGFLRLASGGGDVMFYGLAIPSPFGKNDALHHLGALLHNGIWTNLLLAMLGLHVAAALYHQFILKDGTLRRMA
jgi:cytochrome b561